MGAWGLEGGSCAAEHRRLPCHHGKNAPPLWALLSAPNRSPRNAPKAGRSPSEAPTPTMTTNQHRERHEF